MNIKRLIVFIICILLIPGFVYAEECDSNSIIIKNVSLLNENGETVELSDPSIANNKIKLDTEMHELGDYVEYKLELINKSKENYYFNNKSLNINDEYINYELIFNDNSNAIRPNEEKTINLRITYKNDIPADKINDYYEKTNNYKLNLVNRENLINPNTGSSYILLFLIIIMIISTAIAMIFYKKKRYSLFLIFIISLLISPIIVRALCTASIDVESKLSILPYSSMKGLRFRGEVIDFNFLKNLNYNNKNINGLMVSGSGISFEATSNHSADVKMSLIINDEEDTFYFNYDVHGTVTIETDTDTETSDSKVIVGECTCNPESYSVNINTKKLIKNDLLTYNGKKLSYIVYNQKIRNSFCDEVFNEYKDEMSENERTQFLNQCKNINNYNESVMIIRNLFSINSKNTLCPYLREYLENMDAEEVMQYIGDYEEVIHVGQ